MKLLVIKLAFLCVCCYQGVAQTGKKAFQFKKGEVLDILLVTGTKNNYKKLFDRYKKTAFPVASKFTYQPQSGFRTKKLMFFCTRQAKMNFVHLSKLIKLHHVNMCGKLFN